MTPTEWILVPEAAARSIAWALLHSLWQGSLVAAGLAAALQLARNAKAETRHALALVALLSVIAFPLATFFTSTPSASSAMGASSTSIATASPLAAATGTRASRLEASIERPAIEASLLERSLPKVFWTWILGVVLTSIVQIGGWWKLRELRREGIESLPQSWAERLSGLVTKIGLQRPIQILASQKISVPTVIGWARPVVVVPIAAFAGLSPQAVEALVLHELAHIRRHDPWINLFQAVVETIFFYHPAVFWISKQIRQEREHACDEMAVSLCGSRSRYAKALAEMEGLRGETPVLALAASDGSLLDRLRRLTGRPARPPEVPLRWLAGLTTIGILLTTVMISGRPLEAASEAQRLGKAATTAVLAGLGDHETSISGRYRAEIDGEYLFLEMRRDDRDGYSMSSSTRPLSDFEGIGDGQEGFEIRRDAGRLIFDRDPTIRGTEGRYRFERNASYADRVTSLGYEGPRSEEESFELTLFDVSIDFLQEMAELGYDELDLERAVELRIHGVSPDFVREIETLGYGRVKGDRLVELRIHGVTPDYIRKMNSHGKHYALDRLVEFRIHGVTEDFAREMTEAGFPDLEEDRLVELRIHGVDSRYVKELAEMGFEDLDLDDIVAFAIHGVTESFAREMSRTFGRDLDADTLVSFRIHGVDGRFVRDLEGAGYGDLSADDLVGFKIHGIDAHYVERLRDRGLDHLTVDEVMRIKIHGLEDILDRRDTT